MKKLILFGLIFLVIVTVLGFWGFDHLGGNNPVFIEQINSKPESLAGRTFKGIPQDERLSDYFKEIQTQKDLKPGTYLHTIYEVEPAGKLDTMKVFVGINQAVPLNDFEFKTFEANSYLLAKITGSSWIMPGPKSIKTKLEVYAKENGLELTGVFIDKIISEEEIHVLALLK
jgi:hypothetical protein